MNLQSLSISIQSISNSINAFSIGMLSLYDKLHLHSNNIVILIYKYQKASTNIKIGNDRVKSISIKLNTFSIQDYIISNIMLTIDLRPLMNIRGIQFPYKFLVKLGFPAQTASNWANGSVGYIRPAQLEKLCVALNCTPNDLMQWHAMPNSVLATDHPLRKLERTKPMPDIASLARDLPPEKAAQLAEMIESLKE